MLLEMHELVAWFVALVGEFVLHSFSDECCFFVCQIGEGREAETRRLLENVFVVLASE